MNQLLTISEVAAELRVKPSWVRSMIFKKEIPFIKVGKHIRFNKEAIAEWLSTNQIDSTGGRP